MGRPRISIRVLMVMVAVVGFDAATMARAYYQGKLAHSVREYVTGFGLVLLLLNLDVFALLAYSNGKASRAASGARFRSTPPPLVIAGTYLAVLAVAILSVLFLTSGLF